MCISATIYSKDPNNIEISLYSKIAIGWVGIGMGGSANGMAGNDLAVCWPNATGTGAVISQRSATMNGTPSVTSATVPFKIQPLKSGVTSSTKQFTCTFSRPLSLATAPITTAATSVNVIYAVGLQAVKADAGGDPQKATFQRHAFTGHGALTITKKEGGSLDGFNSTTPTKGGNSGTVGSGGSTGNGSGSDSNTEDLEQILAAQQLYERLVKAHGIMMSIAFLLVFPLGALLVRFFSHLHHVFRWHRPLQVTGFLLAITALVCVIVAIYKSPDAEDGVEFEANPHTVLGVALIAAIILQVCIGIFIFHTFDPNRDPRKIHVPTWMHRIWGYVVLIAGLEQVHLGMLLYGAWPTGKEGICFGGCVRGRVNCEEVEGEQEGEEGG
ncbi:hypothetical protein BC939DRAFT_474880 [Gamsiella multidivaricata]|uniref:uncharacterized protein n=1 Tax=Gamsiella multidivaricata TaxID=101098 RepID=UPI002221078F|nr:uncharacterized protein BC939DRAFT_474880 [Gamsiella multidivaricata]KAI7828151.1 hypothetical protein BC939DRAFT_474880 [Gamsiella multidivaricata]